MAIFKCKMCGGTVEFEQGAGVGVCDSCGTKQTLPRLEDERRANLYDRANHFRRANEFDKAAAIYEQILNEDGSDAEAYWSLVLCRYGIEYVEDPATHKRVPTVNRAQFTSILADEDYKAALQHADGAQKELYQKEAQAIDTIQKGILAISSKEEPFDVFICYKETDAAGRRTQDSVLANDLYYQLTQEGLKVFFARITLEDKLGSAYEPYIFAALHSAKVMVVLGTKPEYFNAVWVKNEWSRYLALVKESGGKRMLIPAYRDMDPYDLPDEFSYLQAQDMSKLGFMQDLIRGIKKILSLNGSEASPAPVKAVSGGVDAEVEPLLKRAFLFLEEGNWKDGDAYCERVLDRDPECARAYIGKLMAELQVRKEEEISSKKQALESENYRKAVRFATGALQDDLVNLPKQIRYQNILEILEKSRTESDFQSCAKSLDTIPGYKDADKLKEQCLQKAQWAHNEKIRSDIILYESNCSSCYSCISGLEKAIEEAKTISEWENMGVLICLAEEALSKAKEGLKRQKEKEEKIRRKKIKIGIGILLAAILAAAVFAISAGIGVAQRTAELESLLKVKKSEIKPGSIVSLGSWSKDGEEKQGLKWLVLDVQDGRVLLLSQAIVAEMKWKEVYDGQWLNGEFYTAAFDDEMKQIIILNADERVFLLSQQTVQHYLTKEERANGQCWWLYGDLFSAYVVEEDGNIELLDDYWSGWNGGLREMSGGVRPAIWINIK